METLLSVSCHGPVHRRMVFVACFPCRIVFRHDRGRKRSYELQRWLEVGLLMRGTMFRERIVPGAYCLGVCSLVRSTSRISPDTGQRYQCQWKR